MLSHSHIDRTARIRLGRTFQMPAPLRGRDRLVSNVSTGFGRDDAGHLAVRHHLGRGRIADPARLRRWLHEMGHRDLGRVIATDPRRRTVTKTVGYQSVLSDRGAVQQAQVLVKQGTEPQHGRVQAGPAEHLLGDRLSLTQLAGTVHRGHRHRHHHQMRVRAHGQQRGRQVGGSRNNARCNRIGEIDRPHVAYRVEKRRPIV